MNKEEIKLHCKKQIKMCKKLNDYKHFSEHQAVLYLLEENQQLQNNWNKLKESVKRRIKSYEDREKLGKGYELTEVMKISLACDRRFLKTMEEIEGE